MLNRAKAKNATGGNNVDNELKKLSELKRDCTLVKGAKAQRMIDAFDDCEPYKTLDDMYETHYSREKEKAYDYCVNLERKYNCTLGGCISANIVQFTYAFVCDIEDDETGEVNQYLVFITKAYNYAMLYR